jgi:hypothetical protein
MAFWAREQQALQKGTHCLHLGITIRKRPNTSGPRPRACRDFIQTCNTNCRTSATGTVKVFIFFSSGFALLYQRVSSASSNGDLGDVLAKRIYDAETARILFRASGPPCFQVNYATRRIASLFAALRCEFPWTCP